MIKAKKLFLKKILKKYKQNGIKLKPNIIPVLTTEYKEFIIKEYGEDFYKKYCFEL